MTLFEEAREASARLRQLLVAIEAEQQTAQGRIENRDQFIRGLGETMRQAVLALQAVEERIQTAQRHSLPASMPPLVALDLSQVLLDIQQTIHNLQMGMPR